ncbi:MAG TPA: hypothetical protein VN495_03190 [Candidatus Paceibacterota bacterium]|nr:hypothetical protein [Candidatus Paceibacterota bacterium]
MSDQAQESSVFGDAENYLQFQLAVLQNLPRAHLLSVSVREHWLQNQSKLQEVLAGALGLYDSIPAIDLDAPIGSIFTEELCCDHLGYKRTVLTRVLNACANHQELEAGPNGWEWVARPIITIRDVARRRRETLGRMTNVGSTSVRLMLAVLLHFGLHPGVEYPPAKKE